MVLCLEQQRSKAIMCIELRIEKQTQSHVSDNCDQRRETIRQNDIWHFHYLVVMRLKRARVRAHPEENAIAFDILGFFFVK